MKYRDAYTIVIVYSVVINNQLPRQNGPDVGFDESGDVQEVSDGFSYPPAEQMIKATLAQL